MRLPRDHAAAQLAKVLLFFRPTEDEARLYVDTIHSACSWMMALQFNEVVDSIVAGMKPGRRPTVAQYLSEYKRIADEKGWKREGAAQCSTCRDMGLLYTDIEHVVTGETRRVLKRCPSCKPGHELHPDWSETPRPAEWDPQEEWMLAHARKLTARGAEKVLVEAEKLAVKYHQSVVAALTDVMARAEKAEEPEIPEV